MPQGTEWTERHPKGSLALGFALLAALGALVIWSLTAIFGGKGLDVYEAAGASEDDVPSYRVFHETKRELGSSGIEKVQAELVVPESTVDEARAAIANYIDDNKPGGQAVATAAVIRGKAAATYVCEGRYVSDEDLTVFLYIEADSFPAVAMNCPNPGGS